MSRRTTAGLLALGLAVVLSVIAAFMPVPYVIFQPGPTLNVLGSYGGKKIIEISGHPTYQDPGALRMVTIYPSGPTDHLSLLTILGSWLSADNAVLPKDAVYHPHDTNATVQQQSAVQMTTSQDDATVAALDAAGIKYRTVVAIAAVDPKGASAGKLKVGDEIISVNGQPASNQTAVVNAIRPLPNGGTVVVKVRRAGAVQTVTLKTRTHSVDLPNPSPMQSSCPDGSPVPTMAKTVSLIGISPAEHYVYPFKVKVSLGDNIGGPSAGMMFAMTIYDLLTPGSLTGGNAIAGSGEISTDGVVGAIGGIGQKLIGAQRDGARLFLVASENWQEAIHANYDKSKMTLVKVHTLSEAIKAVETWRSNPHATLPECAG